MNKYRQILKSWRKKQGARFPYTRRKRYDRAVARLNEQKAINKRLTEELAALADVLFAPSEARAAKTRITHTIPINSDKVDELCLFVTHAATPTLKQHVIDHVESLIEESIAVVLIVNTDHDAAEFAHQPALSSRLSGMLVRQNIGFDFGAWAQVFCMLPHGMIGRRLYFVNDSLVGPFDKAAYRAILARVRGSGADMIGLTQNTKPIPHLQSFFLAFSDRLFSSPIFVGAMTNLLNLPSKNAVIHTYEVQFTGYFQKHGFQCEALFPNIAGDDGLTDDTLYRWTRLIEAGFPFVKHSVLQNPVEAADIARLVPRRYR